MVSVVPLNFTSTTSACLSPYHDMKRKTFLQTAAGAAASLPPAPFAIGKPGKSANGKLNIAFIGAGGWIAQQPYNQGCSEENLVAFCDVDRNQCAENMKNWRTNQPFFDDFRVMLDKRRREIDAVVVSTPDHTHFAATQMAMERGIHVYTQKPLAHNVWQCRTLARSKERYKVVTQMGNQGHADDGIRNSVEAVRAGVIGEVSQVICSNSGPEMGGTHFGNPATMPPPASALPDGLAWDLWLGPTAKRTFYRDYLPPIATTCRSSGAPSTTSAAACWATSAVTPSIRPSGRSISIRPPPSSACSARSRFRV